MLITAKFPSVCPKCQKAITVGASVEWSRGQKAVHATCVAETAAKVQESAAAVTPEALKSVPLPTLPNGRKFFPFQEAGVRWMLNRFEAHSGVLLGDDMGLGKTGQSLGVAAALAEKSDTALRVLVVCPASLRLNWAREASLWLAGRWSVVTFLKADQPHSTREDAAKPGTGACHELVIVNYDILKKVAVVKEREWDLLIGDEIHLCKNPKAQRTKALAEIKAARRILATGTPICNRPAELHTLLALAEPKEWGALGDAKGFFRFAYRYCNPQKVWTGSKYVTDFRGASNLEELQLKLRTGLMLRRLKGDVLTDLPPKTRQVVVLPANGASAVVAKEKALLGDALEQLQAAAEDPSAYDAVVAGLLNPEMPGFEEFSVIRREGAVAKAPYVADLVKDALEDTDGHKVVLMAHHKEVVEILAAALAEFGVVTLTGETSVADRDAAVQKFQNDPACRVFVGSIKAAGVGLTLTAAHHVVFAELDWVPGNVTQAEDRCHRIGQKNNVLVQHVVFDGSLDALLAQMLVSKQAVISAAVDQLQVNAPAPAPEAPAASQKTAPQLPEGYTQAQHDAALAGVRAIAGVCDGAVSEDDMGFNGTDSHFGKAMAARASLTPGMLRATVKMLRKYRNTQLPAAVREVLAPLWAAA